jgi:hypothetical protein
MGDVWLAPYIPLSEETVVGPWLFVPFRAFAQRHARSRATYYEARRLVTAYKLRNTGGMPFGAVVVPRDGRVGDEVPRELLPRLWRALVPALIDLNPSFLDQDYQRRPNAGHAMASADNAQVYGHPLTGEHSYVISQGAMVRQLSYQYAPPGSRLPPVAPPPGLPTPFLGRGLDEDYAAALYDTLTTSDTTARRLDRCIQWQVLAWSNTQVIAEDARVLAFRAAFDVLLGGGSQTRQHGRTLATLLGDESRQRPRRWVEHGRKQEIALNDTEWWFQSFGLLRNAIAHGDVIDEEEWLFDDGRRHLWHADDVLRRAIKRTVIEAVGDDDLELDPGRRYLKRSYERLEAQWAEQERAAADDVGALQK